MSHGYRLTESADLQTRNTFRVAARARVLVEVDDSARLDQVFALPDLCAGPLLVLGEGSNVLFTSDFDGTVVSLCTRDISVDAGNDAEVKVRVDAGANWDSFVHWTLAKGWRGLENLALIPGTVGAAPIQNIGAYGVEASEFIHTVEAWDRHCRELVRLDNAACAFAYRDSLFKRDVDRYLITRVEFALTRTRPLHLEYAGVRDELAAMGIDTPDATAVAEAVTRLRRRKLPDPAQIGNAGSFFKNPLVDAAHARQLLRDEPGLPVWPATAAQRKLSAAWLVEACGLKGAREGDAGVSERHALVLVNHGTATGAQILALAQRIQRSVRARFGVELEPEPRIV